MVRRPCGGKRAHAPARQRHERQVSLRRDDRARRRAVRLRQRRRPGRVPGAGAGARRARRRGALVAGADRPRLPQRPGRQRRRYAHRCGSPTSPRRAGSTRAATAWARPRATSTTTAAWTCTSRAWGRTQLFRNNCDGTFTDVSKASGTADPAWTVSASFVDYDRDGWLDLFVGNYLAWRSRLQRAVLHALGTARLLLAQHLFSRSQAGSIATTANGTFTDASLAAGICARFRPGARRLHRRLQRRRLDGHLRGQRRPAQPAVDEPAQRHVQEHWALLSGTALSAHGKAKAGMGVDAGDFDNDGDEDLFVTNLTGEGNDLYVNDGNGLFEEQSARSGLGPASRGYTGFGTAWFDADNDGWLDTITVNGAVQTIEALRRVNDPFPLHQRKLLFRNLGTGRFEDVIGARRAGVRAVGGRPRRRFRRHRQRRRRGRAGGQQQRRAPAARQRSGQPQSLDWASALVGTSRRDMLGARVGVVRDGRHDDCGGGPDRTAATRRPTIRGCWWASARRPRLPSVRVDLAERHDRRVRRAGAIDRYTTLREGDGRVTRSGSCGRWRCVACVARPRAGRATRAKPRTPRRTPGQPSRRSRFPISRSMEPSASARSRLISRSNRRRGPTARMGRLLMAAEYFEAAEPYLLHAQALAPEDVRWPYYLGHVLHGQRRARQGGRRPSNVRCAAAERRGHAGVAGQPASRPGPAGAGRAAVHAAVSRSHAVVAALFGLGRAALARRDYARAVGLPGAGAGSRSAGLRWPTIRSHSPIASWATPPRRKRTCASGAAWRWARPIR